MEKLPSWKQSVDRIKTMKREFVRFESSDGGGMFGVGETGEIFGEGVWGLNVLKVSSNDAIFFQK